MNAAERLRDLALRHGLYLARYARAELMEIIPILETAVVEIEAMLLAAPTYLTKTRAQGMLRDTKRILSEATGASEAKLFDDLQLLSDYEIEKHLADLSNTVPMEMEFTAPAPEQVHALIKSLPAASGLTMAELSKNWTDKTVQSFTAQIRLGIIEGESGGQIARRIRGRVIRRATKNSPGVYEGGVLAVTTTQANALAMTAVMHVNNTARDAVYAENEDIIKGYQRVETLDARTCLVCAPEDGKVYPVGKPRPPLPVHPRCRGVYVPVLKSWRELGFDEDETPAGTRASMDGQVPETLTYPAWLKQQDEELQDEILGPARAKLFRDGKPIADMVDRGRVLRLAEMVSTRR
jgi:SPP1 gp7 family putative phage head morphogenesis protein